jgi:broad specificity phosphatase PhoE
VIARSRAVDGDVALFAHGHVLRVLAARWIGLPPGGGEHFLLDTSTLSVLGYYRDVPAVRIWNGSFNDPGAHTAADGSGTKVDSSLAPKTRFPKHLLFDREVAPAVIARCER